MNFREITNNKKPIPKEVKTSLGIVDFTPTFEKGDIVLITPKAAESSASLSKIKDLECIVDYCKVADLGNIVAEVVYLEKTSKLIQNPYLVEQFKLKPNGG